MSRERPEDPIVRGLRDALGARDRSGAKSAPRDPEREARMVLGGLLLVAALALSPPAALVAAVAVALRVERRPLWIAGAAGLALVALFSAAGLVDSTWAAAFRQAADAPGPALLVDPGGFWRSFWEAATPQLLYGWGAFLPLTPLLAALADLLRDKQPGEEEERKARATERRGRRAERVAWLVEADDPPSGHVQGAVGGVGKLPLANEQHAPALEAVDRRLVLHAGRQYGGRRRLARGKRKPNAPIAIDEETFKSLLAREGQAPEAACPPACELVPFW